MASLDVMLRAVGKESGGIALLVGEAGIGKTRTAEQLADRARTRGLAVAWGRCWEGEVCPAFGPWVEALRAILMAPDAGMVRGIIGEAAAEMARILPELGGMNGGMASPPDLDAAHGVERLFDSLSRYLRSAAKHRPMVIPSS